MKDGVDQPHNILETDVEAAYLVTQQSLKIFSNFREQTKKSSNAVLLAPEEITSHMIIEASAKVFKMYEIAEKNNKDSLTFSDITKYSLFPKVPGINKENFIQVW